MAHIHYDSYSQFLDIAEHGKRHRNFPISNRWNWSMGDDNPNQKLDATLSDAIETARFGWSGGLARVQSTHITQVEEYINPEIKLDVRYMIEPMSGMFDISRVINGEPEVWVEYEQIQEPSPRILKLLVNQATSGGVSSQTFIQNGCVLMGIIDAIEARGTRVEITIGDSLTDDVITYVLKRSQDTLDREQTIYALAHPSSFRWLMRAVHGHNFPTQIEWGHTQVNEMPSEIAAQYDIVTPRSLLGEINESQSIRWLLNKLSAFGLELAQ